jgi:hypothetical protein
VEVEEGGYIVAIDQSMAASQTVQYVVTYVVSDDFENMGWIPVNDNNLRCGTETVHGYGFDLDLVRLGDWWRRKGVRGNRE